MTRVTDITAALDSCTRDLLATVAALDDPGAESLCEGWTRGHVLTHLARNADAMTAIVRGARQHRTVAMYPSQAVRDADIEAGAGRSREALLVDVRDSAAPLAVELAGIGPDLAEREFERTPGGRSVPVGKLPFMRLREVVFHHVDLDAGYSFGDLSPDLLTLFLTDAVARLATAAPTPSPFVVRTDEGEIWTVGGSDPGSEGTSVSGSRAGILLWLARRDSRQVRAEGPLPRLPHGG